MTDITQILSAFSDKPAATSGAAGSASASPAQFVQQVGPLAKAVADRLNVDPSILIGQWGLETGWGKSVIPGTNNLGNIKDFSGRGIAAIDNMTGSRDKYRQYDSLDGFGDDFAGLIERRYQGAIGAGADAQRFASELKRGGYAEDPAYVEKLVRAAEMARNAGASEGWTPGSRQPAMGSPAAPGKTKSPRARLSEPSEFLSTDQGGKEADTARQQAMLDEGRTFGEAASDIGLGLTSGVGGIVELVGTGAGLASGNMDNMLRAGGASLREWAQDNQSKVLKAHKELRALRMDEMDEGPAKFFAYLAETLGSPELAIDFVAEQAPQLVVMGVTGRLAGGAARAAGLGAEGAGRTATGVAIGAGSTMQGMDAAGQAYDSIKKVPRALQLENPTVQKLMADGVPEDEAVERAARAAAATAGMASGGFSAVLNALPGAASIERALAGGARQAGSRTAGAIKGFVGEGVSEALDEVGGVGAANVATQEFDPSQSITEGMSEAAAAGALFAPFGGVSGALGAGIDAPPVPVVKPNSPLQNAASAAAAVTPPATGPEGSIAPSAADPAAERLARIQSFVEDKAFLQGIRVTPEFGKESVSELLSAYAKARNPSVDPLLREQAMADIEAFIETFNNRPNFTLGGSGQDATQAPGTAVAPVAPSAVAAPQAPTDDGMTIDGEFREPDDRLAGANPNQLPAPPVLALPTEDALQAARDADAAYEQAYQDLVKAEQLGASEAELQAYQRALIEAQQLRDQMDAQLAEADARAEAARQRESEFRRREILASVISEGVPGVNPVSDVAMRFTAELQRQGYREIVPNEDELRMIQRAVDVSAARPELPEVEPSTPDEGQAASAPVARPAPAASSPRDKIAEVRQLVADGWKPGQGRTLVSPTGKKRNINAIELAAAREAYRRKTATQGGADAVQPVQSNAAAQPETEAVPPAVGAAVSQEVTDAAPAQQVAEEAQAESGQKGEASEQEVAQPEIRSPIDAAAHEAATSPLNDKPDPTDGQKSAGNYAKGHIRLHGMDITIENPKGSVRSGTSPDGTAWQNVMAHHYGDIRGSKGADGDAIDVFITDDAESATVAWVIDQKNSDGSFDEHKAVIGAATEADAREAYLANYDEGWDGLGAITSMPMEAFRAWALDGKRKKKPLAYVEPVPPAAVEAMTDEALADELQALHGLLEQGGASNAQIDRYGEILDEQSSRRRSGGRATEPEARWFETRERAAKYLESFGYQASGDVFAAAGQKNATIEPGTTGQGGFNVALSEFTGEVESLLAEAAELAGKTEGETRTAYRRAIEKMGQEQADKLLRSTIEIRKPAEAAPAPDDVANAQKSLAQILAEQNAEIDAVNAVHAEVMAQIGREMGALESKINPVRNKGQKRDELNDRARESRLANEAEVRAILDRYRPIIDAHPEEIERRAESRRKTQELKAQMAADRAPQPITSTPFATFEQLKTALKVLGDVPAIQERLRDRNVANIPGKGWVNVPNKLRWDEVRANIPVRIDTYRLAGVPERFADVTVEVMESGSAVVKNKSASEKGESAQAALTKWVETYKDMPEQAAAPQAEEPVQAAAAEAPQADGFEADVQSHLARFESGDFGGTPDAAYRAAATRFLEGDLTAKLPTKAGRGLDIEGLENIAPKPIKKSIRPAKTIADKIKAVRAVGGQGDVRYYLDGVHFEPEAGRMVATDGHRLVVVEGVDFSAANLPERQNAADSGHPRTVLGDDGKWIDGIFPDWSRVMPANNGQPAAFNAERVSAMARGVEKAKRYAHTGREMPTVPVDLWGGTAYLNAQYLADAADLFRRMGYDSFLMSRAPNGQGPVLMASADGNVRLVISPVRADDSPFFGIAPDIWADEKALELEAIKKRREDQGPSASASTAAGQAEFEHNGVRIYPVTLNIGGEKKRMWAVESAANRAKREAGERHGFGDDAFETPEAARDAADRQIQRDADQAEAQRRDEEEKAAAKAAAKATKADTINGFLDGKNPMTAGQIRSALDKQYRFDGEVMTVRERIESLQRAGTLAVSTFEEPKIKPMSRAQFNRASQREQDAHEKKMREAGTKTVYLVNGSDLGKTGYDYAQHLLGEKSAQESGRYTGPADVSSRAGQMEMANRAGTIAALKAMNSQLRAIAPDEAWADANIEEAADLDALRDQISKTLVRSHRGDQQADGTDELRNRLDGASGAELRAVFDALGLAVGARMTHTERVEALMREDAQEVAGALDDVLKDGEQAAAEAPADAPAVSQPDAQPDAAEQAEAMTEARTEAATDDLLTPDQARALMAWEDAGQRDNVKSHNLKFFESAEDMAANRSPMIYGTIESYQGGKWNIDGTTYPTLKAAKAAAVEQAIERLRNDGYVTRADAAAQEAADAVTAEQKPKPAEQPGGVDDVGASLLANRRNFTSKAMSWDDVKDLNETLRVRQVVKSKVWQKPDYEQLVKDGMPAHMARYLKGVYDALGAKPTHTTEGGLQRYLGVVGRVREAAMAIANDARYQDGSYPAPDELLTRVWPGEMVKSRYERFGRGSEGSADAIAIGGNRAFKKMQPDRREQSKWKKELDEGWPAKQEAWQRQGYRVLAPGEYAIEERDAYRWDRETGERIATGGKTYAVRPSGSVYGAWSIKEPFSNEKYVLVQKGTTTIKTFDSEDAAVEAAREAVKRTRDVSGQDIRGMNIAEAVRQGPARREEGENITSARLMETFGFRGVNFGRKGYINDAERQEYLNQSFDALMDFAELLNVPPKALSLNGALGIAFGAQGSGGFAAAHFVPGFNEINLTKTKGAGTLAHEWAHALDHYFAAQAGLATDSSPFLSAHANLPDTRKRFVDGKSVDVPTFSGDIRPEIVGLFRAIRKRMDERNLTEEEMAAMRDNAIERSRKNLESWVRALRAELESRATPEHLATFDKLAERMKAGDIGPMPEGALRHARVDEMLDIAKEINGRRVRKDFYSGIESNARQLAYLMQAESAEQSHISQTGSTTYARESAAKDRKKGGDPYWATPWEMFARAFDLFVHDRLVAADRVNTFLSDAGLRVEHMTTEEGSGGKEVSSYSQPFPRNEERDVLNAVFGDLVDTMRTRETDDGVAMYEISDSGDPSPEEAQTVQAGIAGKNPIEAAAWLADNAPPEYATIAAKARDKLRSLNDMGAKFGMAIVTGGDLGEVEMSGARGAVIPTKQGGDIALKVVINGADMKGRVGTSYRTVTHELVHAATMQSIQLGMRGVSQYEQATRDLFDVANAIADHINERARNAPESLSDFEISILEGRRNFLSSADEVLAWALTSPDAQSYLESIPYKRKSAWTAFVEAVRKVLGLSASSDTALSEVLRVAEVLLTPIDTAALAGFTLNKINHSDGHRYEVQQPADLPGGLSIHKSPGGLPPVAWTDGAPVAMHPDAAREIGDSTDVRLSFAGQYARTADRLALDTAQRRIKAGEDAETVRQETGWFRGVDGKWRFEINDADASLINMREDDGAGHRATYLADILDHPALFAAYPALRSMDVVISFSPGSRQRGMFEEGSPGDDLTFGRSPQITVEASTKDDALRVLLHEIQHGIQNIEGFATGGSSAAIEMLEEKTPDPDFAIGLMKWNRELHGLGYPPDKLMWEEDLPMNSADLIIDLIEDQMYWMARVKGFDESRIDQIYYSAFDEPPADLKVFAGLSPYEQYRRLAGEVESRNVDARGRMTDAERRSTPPSQTADVADSDVIVVFNGAEMDSAPAPANATSNASAQGVIDRVEADAFIRGVVERYPESPEIIVARTFAQLPEAAQQGAYNQGSDEYSTKGIFHGGKAYVVMGNHTTMADLEATVFHELLGHAGVRKMFGAPFVQRLNQVFIGLGGQAGLVRIMKRRGMGDQMQRYIRGALQAQKIDADRFRQAVANGDPRARRVWTDAMMRSVLTEEVLAHIAEQIGERPGLLDRFLEMMGRIRQWLRDHGFAQLSNLGESDLLYMLSQARESLRGPGGPGGSRVVKEGKGELFDKDGSTLTKAEKDALAVVLGALDENSPRRDQALQAMRMLGIKQEPGVTMFSIRSGSPAINKANQRTALFTALAKFDDAFQQPTPTGKTVEEIAREIDPSYRAKAMPAALAKDKTRGRAVKMWEISVPKSSARSGYLYEDARGRVWIDVSRLQPGIDAGNKIYGIAAGYAHNADKVFIGDPEGLSPTALFRRLENMISSALRFGTTDHLYPHGAQVDPEGYFADSYPEFAPQTKGLGLDWKDGDFSHNLTEMLRVSYNASARFAPEIKEIVYDFDSRQFVDAATGDRRDRRDFARISEGLRGESQTRYRGGSATLARAALVNTLLRRGGKEAWGAVVASLGDQLRGRGLDFELGRIFYQRTPDAAAEGLTANQFRAALVDHFGEAGVKSLEQQGLLNIVDPNDPEVGGTLDPNNPAWYNPETGEAFFVPSAMSGARDAVEAVYHEIGAHHGLPSMLGESGWRTLKSRVAMAAKGSGEIGRAWRSVIDNYPEFADLAAAGYDRAAQNDRFMHEVIAKVGESAAGRKSSIWTFLQDRVRAFLRSIGLEPRISAEDVAALVQGSMKRVMTNGGNDGPRGGSRMNQMRSTPSSPSEFFASSQGRRSVRDRIGDVFSAVTSGDGVRTFNWWNRTVGSQYHKAKKSPEFRKVYELAHAYVDEISRIANTAAGQAKNILPHLDSWKDIGAGLNIRKQWADAKDYQAIASAVFDGTLANGSTGTVWTDEQLRDQFGLNDKQVGLYREFRAAVDVSLESLATSEMARAARVAKLKTADPEMTMSESLAFYTDQVDAVIEKAKADIEDLSFGHEQERAMFEEEFGNMRPGATEDARRIMTARQRQEMAELEAAFHDAEKLRSSFTDKASQIRKLQSEGYAPLMRFGQYTVDVVRLDEDGNPAMNEDGEPDRPFFGMFETEAEAREAERVLREEYPDYTVTRGVMSAKANEMFKGVTPETAEMFARLLGTDQEGAFQAYLKQAVANRSAMKRLIERKGMAGFAQDVPRVLAAFITSNARLSAGNWHFGEMTKAAQDIPREKGDVKDEAIKLVDYIQNPQEEAAGLRGFLFFSFLGGSVAAALVNTTQTFSTTLPYLHQFNSAGSAKAITRAMGVAYKAMRKGLDAVKDDKLRAALERASNEGIVDPQEIHLLMAESGGNGASSLAGSVAGMVRSDLATPVSRVMRAATQAWGSLFGMAEKYNRHVAFMAAWEVAGEMSQAQIEATGAKDRYDFAKRAVTETQFEYRKISRPNLARGAIGATVFTFKTFLVNYLEFIARLPSRERALAIAVLLLLAGTSGAPGIEDLDDVIDAIGQKFGYNWNNAAGRHAWLVKTLGEGGANFVEHGVSSLLPIDVSARLGMGNIIPGTEALKKSNSNKAGDAVEALGPIGSVIEGGFKVFDGIGTGKDFGELIRPVAPKAYNDIYQAIDILQTGYYRDTRGRKVVEAGALDAFMKSIGFQPNVVAEPRRVEWMIGQSARMQRVIRSDIYELWSRGVFESDQEKVALARERVRDWNRKNPETPITVNPKSIAQRVKAMRSSSAERMVNATPKEMRGMIRDELAVGD